VTPPSGILQEQTSDGSSRAFAMSKKNVEQKNREAVLEARSTMLQLVPSHKMIDDRGMREARRVLAVKHRGEWYYPTFQFHAEAEPYAEMHQVHLSLGALATGWDVLQWFIEPNEFLGGRTPLEVWIAGDRPSVVAAAQQEHWFELG
jgi:hypothetical protein